MAQWHNMRRHDRQGLMDLMIDRIPKILAKQPDTADIMETRQAMQGLLGEGRVQGTRITAAAHRTVSGTVYTLPPPNRHAHVLRYALASGATPSDVHGGVQGFVTDTGQFLDRKDALLVAERAKQIKRKSDPQDQLFTEDLF